MAGWWPRAAGGVVRCTTGGGWEGEVHRHPTTTKAHKPTDACVLWYQPVPICLPSIQLKGDDLYWSNLSEPLLWLFAT